MSSRSPLHKSGRSVFAGVKLAHSTGINLVLAFRVTITLLFGIVLDERIDLII